MATAKFGKFPFEVETDLGEDETVGASTSKVSGKAGVPPTFHRLNPYFVRPGRRIRTVKVEFRCAHTDEQHIEYAADPKKGRPAEQVWTGVMDVSKVRTRRNGAKDARGLLVTSPPGAKIARQITCDFRVVATWGSDDQQWTPGNTTDWDPIPEDEQPTGGCHISYTVTP